MQLSYAARILTNPSSFLHDPLDKTGNAGHAGQSGHAEVLLFHVKGWQGKTQVRGGFPSLLPSTFPLSFKGPY